MNNSRNLFILFLALVLVTSVSSLAQAQFDEHPNEDYSTTPLVQPTVEDFAPLPEPQLMKTATPS